MNRRQRASLQTLALGAVAALAVSGLNAAELKLGNAGELEIKGDIRLRQESKTETGATTSSNKTSNRQRYRLRVGMNYKLDSKLSVKTQLASGNGEQTSTNQTLDNNGSQKSIFIDMAYVDYKPMDLLAFYGGRMKNPLWQTYSSDIVWDTDYNPEGLAESFKMPVGNTRLFANFLQGVINEDKAGSGAANKPQYLFSNQVGVTVPVPMDSRFTLAGALHSWVNERERILTSTTSVPVGKQAGTNTLSSGKLADDFRVVEVGGELYTNLPAIDIPLSLQGTFIKNTAHRPEITPTDDTGYQFGGILGKAASKNAVEIAFFRKISGTDSTVADIADSDFPGTNRAGNIYWLAYGLSDVAGLKAKYFDSKVINGTKKDIQLLQVDFQVKF